MQPRLTLPDRRTLLSEIVTDVMPAIKPIKPVEIASKQAWSPAYPAATAPRDKPSWTRRITHASTMRVIWVAFEIALFCIVLVRILLQVAAYR